MAKIITDKWQDALALLSDCRVVSRPEVVENGSKLLLVLQDPSGQRFILQVKGLSIPGRNGNLLTLTDSLAIVALEPQPGDRIGDVQF